MALPIDSSVEAEYADGYIHSETNFNDASPYVENKNILNDLIEKRPEAEHGKMVRFSVFYKANRYDIDWTELPDNARPIRFRHAQLQTEVATGNQTFEWLGVDFGYQYTQDGQNYKEIKEIK